MSTIKFDFRHNYRRGERREAASAAYQWDLGHEAEIYVPATATYEVHYTRPGWSETEDYAVESCTAVADGGYKLIAHIPNKYFETSGELGLYIVGSADDHVITTYEGYITILGRKEPEDYTDDDPENGAETIIEKAREYANQSEAWAVGEIDGEPVPSTEPQYHNNAKYYLEQAAAEATAAAASAAAAAQSAAAVDFASIAPQFSASTAYSAGDYVYYNELLYCFTADHAAGSWTGTDATQVTVGEELDDLKGAMSNVEGTLITDTASGAIATFPDGADNFPVKDLKVWIEPVQDLHGYDHPWPEGGGKNIFNYDAWRPDIKRGTAVYENNGVTLTATSNDCYTDYGSTYSSDARIPITEGETITLCWEETTNTEGMVYIFPNGTESGLVSVNNANAKKLSYTAGSGVTYVTFRIGTGYSGNTIYYKNIQVVKGTTVPTSFSPYSNICPISGFTGCNVSRTGKNLFDYNTDMASGTNHQVTFTFNVDKTWTVNGTATNGASDWLLWDITKDDLPSGTYIISREIASSNVQLYIDIRKNNTRVGQITNMLNIEEYEFAIDWDCGDYDLLRVGLYVNNGVSVSNVIVKPMLRLASILDSAYEPRVSNLFPISFPTSAGTVYGGTLDVTTGVLTVNRIAYSFTGDERIDCHDKGLNNQRYALMINTSGYIQLPIFKWPLEAGDMSSSHFKWTSSMATSYGAWRISQDRWLIFTDAGSTHKYADATEFKAYLAEQYSLGTPVQISYIIAEPITYQCTPTEVRTLLGLNNIWADAGLIDLTYRADTKLYIEQLTKPDADMIADANITSGSYFMVGNGLYLATANIANGSAIVVGTNCTRTNLAEALNTINA